MDATETKELALFRGDLIAGLNRIADAIILLARATAGEFDDQADEPIGAQSLSEVR